MKTTIMFQGYRITGYLIKRIGVEDFIFYIPRKFRIIKAIVDHPFLALGVHRLAIPDYARGGKTFNPGYKDILRKYPICSDTTGLVK